MCVMSMVMEGKYDDWTRRYWPPYIGPEPMPVPVPVPVPYVPLPTKEELDDFRRLLERAREYDRKTGQPDCELEEKRQKLKDLAETLGVEINFV